MKLLFNLYALALALFAILCAILMTEPGQMVGVPRDWVLGYFRYMHLFWGLQLVALALFWYVNHKHKFWQPIWMWLATAGVLITFWVEADAMATAFPTEQFTAQYYSVEEADPLIPKEDSRVYVVELNGEVRIFPRYHVQIPHVAGWESNGQGYALAYCGLSNLPMVVETDYGLGASDLQVLGQTHNNLVFKDVNNHTAIQHITMQSEFTDHETTVHPNTMMDWEVAKSLYPNAKVYIYGMDRALDDVMMAVFEEPLKDQRDVNNPDFIFDTLDLEDTRLNPKQEIYGYNDGKRSIAIDPQFARASDGYEFQLSGETVRISTDGHVVKLYDVAGNLLPIHNGVHYGIWTQFFPMTEVLK